MKVTSGFRGFQLNKAVGGSTTSAHSIGAAADIVPVDGDMKKFKQFVKDWLKKTGTKFDQYIDEKNGSGSEWVHLGLINKDGKQRCQYLMYRNRTYVKIQ